MSTKCGRLVEVFWDGMDAPYEIVRGHVSCAEAAEALWEAYGDRVKVPAVEYRHARWIPVRHSDYDIRFELSEPGPGAFAVTLVHDYSDPGPNEKAER